MSVHNTSPNSNILGLDPNNFFKFFSGYDDPEQNTIDNLNTLTETELSFDSSTANMLQNVLEEDPSAYLDAKEKKNLFSTKEGPTRVTPDPTPLTENAITSLRSSKESLDIQSLFIPQSILSISTDMQNSPTPSNIEDTSSEDTSPPQDQQPSSQQSQRVENITSVSSEFIIHPFSPLPDMFSVQQQQAFYQKSQVNPSNPITTPFSFSPPAQQKQAVFRKPKPNLPNPITTPLSFVSTPPIAEQKQPIFQPPIPKIPTMTNLGSSIDQPLLPSQLLLNNDIIQLFEKAIESSDWKSSLQSLIEQYSNNIFKMQDMEGKTLVIRAAEKGAVHCLTHLLQEYKIPLCSHTLSNNECRTPFFYLIQTVKTRINFENFLSVYTKRLKDIINSINSENNDSKIISDEYLNRMTPIIERQIQIFEDFERLLPTSSNYFTLFKKQVGPILSTIVLNFNLQKKFLLACEIERSRRDILPPEYYLNIIIREEKLKNCLENLGKLYSHMIALEFYQPQNNPYFNIISSYFK